MTLSLFWVSLALIAYTYLLFPLCVFLRARWLHRPYEQGDAAPTVSLIIAAHNEAQSIGKKIENILSMRYPRERLDVLIASDGSNDDTENIVRSYSDQGVELLALPRNGKAAALNAAVEASQGEVLAFSDANSMFDSEALAALVRPFADPQVGGVAGDQRYLKQSSRATTDVGEQSYWNFDRRLKVAQSRAGNVTSATGAIYAIRRSLFLTVPDGVTDDFVTSTRVIAQGRRLVFASDAKAYEPVASSSNVEFGRKVRVITRGLRGVWLVRELLNPFQHGFYSIQLFSHKVLRRLMVFPLLTLMAAAPLLWGEGLVYQVVALALFGLGCGGVSGMLLSAGRLRLPKLVSLPFFFCLVNAASFMAVHNLVRGRRIDRWEPQRHGADPIAEGLLISTTTNVRG